MNQMPRIGLFVSLVAGLAGCPIYGGSSSDGPPTCDAYSDCRQTCTQDSECGSNAYCSYSGNCTAYPQNTTSSGQGGHTSSSTGSGFPTTTTGGQGGASPTYCGHPSDCSTGETCAPDGTCHAGNCVSNGCIFGFICDNTATPPSCKPENPSACGSDSECSAAGEKCVNGTCTIPADQCFDQTQCAAGDVCAAGKCTPSCSPTQQCTGSYSCSNVGTCTVPVKTCTITNDCGGPNDVCVDGACVPRSPNGSCDTGFVWVENGCIPDQHASFVCTIDGQQDACANGSLCLHHSCYISCAPPNPNACSGLPSFNQCKGVTTSSGAHQVCGSASNLGGQCDPTAGLACTPGLICIDGFCK